MYAVWIHGTDKAIQLPLMATREAAVQLACAIVSAFGSYTTYIENGVYTAEGDTVTTRTWEVVD